MKPWRAVSLLLLMLPAIGNTDGLVLESAEQQTGLLEVYTSEGCSSCPPADRFVSSLVDDPRVFEDFIPLAFHVDYWDYLGWSDRFAMASFSERQRAYARAGGVNTVYTPGFLYNGQEWRNFFGGDLTAFPAASRPGVLRAELEGDQLAVEFMPSKPVDKSLTVHVAILGFGLETDVARGENHGRRLSHDFVVLAHKATSLATKSDGLHATLTLPKHDVHADRLALTTWVQADFEPPLQAVGGYIK